MPSPSFSKTVSQVQLCQPRSLNSTLQMLLHKTSMATRPTFWSGIWLKANQLTATSQRFSLRSRYPCKRHSSTWLDLFSIASCCLKSLLSKGSFQGMQAKTWLIRGHSTVESTITASHRGLPLKLTCTRHLDTKPVLLAPAAVSSQSNGLTMHKLRAPQSLL